MRGLLKPVLMLLKLKAMHLKWNSRQNPESFHPLPKLTKQHGLRQMKQG
jgi:hypothetical protein